MNIALFLLAAALVLAVAIALVMAGRVRQREQSAQTGQATAAQEEHTGETAEHESMEEGISEAGAQGEEPEAAENEPPDGASGDGAAAESDSVSPGTKTVLVEVDGEIVLEAPLNEEAKYAIVDGQAVTVDAETTLEDMQGIADPANHDVNLIYIHEGKVACTESNCENQVCVHTGEMTGSEFDLPIVCLPHGVVVRVEG